MISPLPSCVYLCCQMAHSTHTAIKPMMPSEPRDDSIAVTLATTLISGMNGMFPSPRTSKMIARAAMLTPTFANAPAHSFTLLSISMRKYLLLVYGVMSRSVFKYTHVCN